MGVKNVVRDPVSVRELIIRRVFLLSHHNADNECVALGFCYLGR